MNIVDQPWFWPTVAVVVGLPIAIVVLSECIVLLDRRGSRAARVLAMVRDWVLPTGALLILLGQVEDPQLELSWGRIVATVFGIVVILVIVNAINHLMFTRAAKGTWRERLPSIFIDIARIAVVVVGVGLLMSWVWDADVGGLFAALGVTSIIVGLALQHAVGGVISGLLLLFEQPFEQGEWIDTGDVRGRVVEVNWRSVHLATGDGMRVVPNAVLADASFTNLSRTAGPQFAEATVEFDPADPPNTVKRLLVETAADLPDLPADAVPEAAMEGGGAYTVSIPVHSPGDRSSTLEAFRTRLWYSARRAGLTLSGVGPVDENAAAELAAALRSEASVLNLDASSAMRPARRSTRAGSCPTPCASWSKDGWPCAPRPQPTRASSCSSSWGGTTRSGSRRSCSARSTRAWRRRRMSRCSCCPPRSPRRSCTTTPSSRGSSARSSSTACTAPGPRSRRPASSRRSRCASPADRSPVEWREARPAGRVARSAPRRSSSAKRASRPFPPVE